MEQLPDIMITYEDLEILSGVVRVAMEEGRFVAAHRLGNELHRARIVPAAQAPGDCLLLNGAGRYLEEPSGAIRDVVLVAGRRSPGAGCVSVLSQVGTALIGLSAGQRIGWHDARGRPRALHLLEVRRRRQ